MARGEVWLRGLDWLESQRRQFAARDSADDAIDLFPLKVLAEVARICDVLSRSPRLDAATRARLSALLRFVWEQYGEGRVFAEVLAAGPYLVVGTMYSIFEAHGYTHPDTRARLARLSTGGLASARLFPPRTRPALDAPAPFGRDAAAVLALGLGLAWRRMGLPSRWSPQRLYPQTTLSRRAEIASLSEAEAYSLTHVVFFVTDFGEQPTALDEPSRSYLRRLCPGWMDEERRRRNLDLYSELAAALACAGEPPTPEVERVLHEAQDADGSLPGPGFRSRRRLEAAEDEQRRRFLERYHTTLAAMLASFAATAGLARGQVG